MPSNWGATDAYPEGWDRIAREVIQQQPVCQIQGPDCSIESTECDHIVPIARGGTHERSNLQGVCHECHLAKTKREAQDGRTIDDPRVKMSPGFVDAEVNSEAEEKTANDVKDWFYSYGPAHEKDEKGEYILPKYTLGWEVLAWSMSHLQLKGKPFQPTPEQARFYLWAYAVEEDEKPEYDGRWIYKRILKIAGKGYGKDPMLAVIAYVEILGPSRFAGWRVDAFGEKTPLSRDIPGAEFQIGALSEDQARITWKYLKSMPTEYTRRKYGIETPKGPNIFAYKQTRKITALSSTAATKEGEVIDGAALSEGEHGTRRNGFFDLDSTLRGNVAKSDGGRQWYISNAYKTSTNSFTQSQVEEYEDYLHGRIVNPRLMVDGIFATEKAPYDTMEHRLYVLRTVFSNVPWVNYLNAAEEFDSTTEPIENLLPKWYNCIAAGVNSWADIRDWDNCPIVDFGTVDGWPPKGSGIVLSFDGSYNDDCTVLRGKVFDGPFHGASFKIGIWTPPKRKIGADGKREAAQPVDRADVDAKVAYFFKHYSVLAFWGDPSHRKDSSDVLFWKPTFDRWHQEYGHSISRRFWATKTNAINFDMASSTNSSRFVEQLDKTQALITDRQYKHTTDEEVRTHLMNTVRKTKAGHDDHIIGKRSPQSPDKMDFTVGMVIGDIPFNLLAAHMNMTQG